MSMTATGTPLPVEYCQALLMFSMVKPGAVTATLGSATVIVRAQAKLCRIGWSEPGLPSGGTRLGSTLGGGIAWAAGRLADGMTSRPASTSAAIRCNDARAFRAVGVIAYAPR